MKSDVKISLLSSSMSLLSHNFQGKQKFDRETSFLKARPFLKLIKTDTVKLGYNEYSYKKLLEY